ncbi:MAG: hypothetical protein V3V56_08520 [bacterium]
MKSGELNMATEVIGYMRFLFVTLERTRDDKELNEGISSLGDKMENMHVVDGSPTIDASRRGRFQYLRAEKALSSERDIAHPKMLEADILIRIECETTEPLEKYEEGLRYLIEGRGGEMETLAGVQRPRSYTSHAMTQYAYERALPHGPGAKYPIGVVMPQNKNDEWWRMDWMRRESFFLPRYDDEGTIFAKGHALAAEEGIPCISRRLVHHPDGYGLAKGYDFIGYFEFAEESAGTFRSVMTALRSPSQNPEWAYVSEGPEWWGRRVGKPVDLWPVE